MKVKVLFFAALREQLGTPGEEVELPGEVSSVGALRTHLSERGDKWKAVLAEPKLVRAAVNQDMVPLSAPVKPGDEVAFFPPVTGG